MVSAGYTDYLAMTLRDAQLSDPSFRASLAHEGNVETCCCNALRGILEKNSKMLLDVRNGSEDTMSVDTPSRGESKITH